MPSKYQMDEDAIQKDTMRNMHRRSTRDIPYVSFDDKYSDLPEGVDYPGSRAYQLRQSDRLFRRKGLGVFDRGDEDVMRHASFSKAVTRRRKKHD